MKIDLLGPYPPPYGGVSVHLERLKARLDAGGHEAHVIAPHRADERNFVIAYRRILREARSPLLHAHVNGLEDKLVLGLLATWRRRVILTIHGASLEDQFRRCARPMRILLAAAVKRLDALIAVNDHIHGFATGELGVAPARVHTIPAFLPPDREAAGVSPGPEVEAFLAHHSPVLCANAFHLLRYEGAPLYGADLMLDLLAASTATHPKLGVVLYVSTTPPGSDEELAALRARAEQLGVASRFRVILGSRPFNPLLIRSAAMLRPTVTEGDAVSIREALWFGIPVIASDVVARPPGTLLFRSRDAEDFWGATRRVLDDPSVARDAVAAYPRRDGYEQIEAIYRSLAV